LSEAPEIALTKCPLWIGKASRTLRFETPLKHENEAPISTAKPPTGGWKSSAHQWVQKNRYTVGKLKIQNCGLIRFDQFG
jgi:hypothetical protein